MTEDKMEFLENLPLKHKIQLQKFLITPTSTTVYQAVQKKMDAVAKPLDGLGKFEHLIAQIGAIQGNVQISTKKKAVLVMCADNGIVEEGVSQSGKEVTLAVTRAMGQNQSSVGKMAAVVGADVIPVDIGIDTSEEIPGVLSKKVAHGTRNFAKEPAMSEQETLLAIETGIRLVGSCKEQGYDLLATGEMGIGNTTTSTAVVASLLHLDVKEITGRGAGLDDASLSRKCNVIEDAITKYSLIGADAFTILQTVGGLDIAGLTGIFIGGALYQIPVLVDGVISSVAALLAERLCPGCKDYMIPSHKSREQAASKVMKELQLDPVLDADMALGEGTGAVMMMSLLDIALQVYEDGSSFDEFQIEQYERYSS
ncbi:MAG: nicotinate-nucleotide--dimethylbenzimidazole phosphoribosyltransferase [Roseburia sp.]|uniref:nicotinate-nucleotide--dimethylbenzimidazole phosphoribosyltransferase n=1 Tax=Roseburia sp. 831b TaxID=1261635 RepID=UPI001FA866D8|nr:nicotinate-nucleotide--dimethylbenzimidazole phosphoribosyltransferase [Roseburia sp. 831b]MCI5919170.1 nicotinate-nucleotide--dimethylbenzimidazole phosphoribosyltransferase [Roseburia sp.]MDD6217555.1 nicotinate-nucleotide--dimethylbenzimidazole phosphoribosyltransferase [Roseburia sp.]MDY5881972.1 nicotinate-nucleotide--dimethylbenzimidazole phosphoribosyltransferase [Roseburia sp.]WVK74556.1 nicotinate-nucleotide--dimethylbenzimidazole phosphoribosyltransferase [Roseburia sp. 831b]